LKYIINIINTIINIINNILNIIKYNNNNNIIMKFI